MKDSFRAVKSYTLLLILGLLTSQVVAAQQVSVDHWHKFDEFYGVNWESAMAHLDGFALGLNNNPSEVGAIIIYGGQHRRRGEASAWSACVKDYLVNRRGISADKLVMVDGGYRQSPTVELWGTADRRYIPTPSQQLRPKDVRFTKGQVGRWRRMCNN